MAVKSIKFKLTIGSQKFTDVRRGLFKTHEIFNDGVRYYQQWLLSMRQRDVYRYIDDEPIVILSKEDCQAQLLDRLRAVQVANQGTQSHDDAELLQVMRELYELLVPSSVGGKGDAAQIARKFLSPLAWEESDGLTGKSKAGAKPRWQKLKEQGEPWEEAYEKWKQSKESDVGPLMRQQLERLGLRPFLAVYTESTPDVRWLSLRDNQGVRTWDRDMFQQAIEGLLSWESWNRRVGDEYQALVNKVKEYEQKFFSDNPEWATVLRRVEDEMRRDSSGFVSEDEFAHGIRSRAVRGWEKISNQWRRLSEKGAPDTEYMKVIKEAQRKDARRFGSEPLFKRLASPNVRAILLSDPSVVKIFAKYNELNQKLESAKQYAQKTLPDAVQHPVWTRFDKRGGNLHNYEILPATSRQDLHQVVFSSLLMPLADETFAEVEQVTLPLAPSLQFETGVKGTEKEPKIGGQARTALVTAMDEETGEITVRYRDRGYPSTVPVKFGGAKLQFHRDKLRAMNDKGVLRSGATGPVYLNVTIDVEAPPERTARNVLSRSRDGDQVYLKVRELDAWMAARPEGAPGLRVMSVDLGVRYGATISVFEVKPLSCLVESDRERLHFCIDGAEEYAAIHERSVVLKLPGEGLARERHNRELANDISSLKSEIGFLKRVLVVSQATEENRLSELDKLLGDNHGRGLSETAEKQSTGKPFHEFVYAMRKLVDEWRDCVNVNDQAWEKIVLEGHRRLEQIVDRHIRAFRSKQKNRHFKKGQVQGPGGLSISHIENLTNERKLLIRWSTHPRVYGSGAIRLPAGQTFAKSLQQHINHVKEDRIKKLADMLVMTARGYRFDEEQHKWIQMPYAACDLILFEDLSRYRFKSDRSPSENRQLMQWSHRELLSTVKMQADVFKMEVGTVRAEFSSRYDAQTGAPGVRCKQVGLEDEQLGEKAWLLRKYAKEHGVRPSDVSAGQLVPVRGGEWFVSPKGYKAEDGVKCIHADINAAHNLQRRFWRREIFRVSCNRVRLDENFAATPLWKSFTDTFGKGLFYSKDLQGEVYTYTKGAKLKGKQNTAPSLVNLSDDGWEEADEDWVDLNGSERITLFRDLSDHLANGDWVDARAFWGRVERIVGKALLQKRTDDGGDGTVSNVE